MFSMEIIGGRYTIKQIFQDHWDAYLQRYPDLPQYVLETVEKMLSCRDPQRLGYIKVACPSHPTEHTTIPHSCKSRLCSKCGKVAADRWIEKTTQAFPNVPYRHLTFTVPWQLRVVFKMSPKKRLLLFQASSRVVLAWCQERGFLPAVLCVLHTFGRDMKDHPHIHMLISAGGLDQETKEQWVVNEFFPEAMLKKRFKTILLTTLHQQGLIGTEMKRWLFALNWYLYVAHSLMDVVSTTRYVGRYTRRPPIAEARLEGYNPAHGGRVMFRYADWYAGKQEKVKTVTVEEFITLLLQHIPPKHFKLVCQYGLLHNRVRGKYLKVVEKLFGKLPDLPASIPSWRERQKQYRGVDPLVCQQCGKEKQVVEVAHFSRKDGKLKIIPAG